MTRLALFPTILALLVAAAAAAKSKNYIVRFKTSQAASSKSQILRESPTGSVKVTKSYDHVLNGAFAATLTPEGVQHLSRQPGVIVEPDIEMHAFLPVARQPAPTQSGRKQPKPPPTSTQSKKLAKPQRAPRVAQTSAAKDKKRVGRRSSPAVAPASLLSTPWGLDRIDQVSLPLNNAYYPDTALPLQDVHIFVIDTGMYRTHSELRDFVAVDDSEHWSSFNATEGDVLAVDRDGHGTHCAGSAAGSTVGVAAGSRLHAVKVLDDNGSGSTSSVLGGMDFVLQWTQQKRAELGRMPLVVASMSLGGGRSAALDAAVGVLHSADINVVVAAGNDGSDACSYSPAAAPSAITVGSTTHLDTASSFSNYGSCVDIFAPGSQIVSASIEGPERYSVLSGTSMATPHVAGVVAQLRAQNPTLGSEAITSLLLSRGVPDALSNGNGLAVPNLLVQAVAGPPSQSPSPPSPCAEFSLVIVPDEYPEETTWDVKEVSSGNVVVQGFANNATVCLAYGDYEFEIYDSYNDGICCEYGAGSYHVYAQGQLVGSGGAGIGAYPDGETTLFTLGDNTPPACFDFALVLIADDYPGETTWDVKDRNSGSVVLQGAAENATECLPRGDYEFEIYDSWGDGICCDYGIGSYHVYAQGQLVASGGPGFGAYPDGEATDFTLGTGTPPSCYDFSVSIIADDYPEETTWDVKNRNSGAIVLQGAAENATECLPAGSYEFEIYDSWGDGLCCAYGMGSYHVYAQGQLIASGGPNILPFPNGESTNFTLGDNTPPSCFDVEVSIVADDYPAETTWDVKDLASGTVVMQGNATSAAHCLPAGDYEFEIYDSFEDGMCCSYGVGGYRVTAQGRLVASGGPHIGAFPNGMATEFTLSPAGPPPCSDFRIEIVPDNYPLETSWDVKDQASGRALYGGGATNATECLPVGNYEFEIYDSFGDGLCCSYGIGSYKAWAQGNLVASGGVGIGSYPEGESTLFTIV